jgi:hypothetical protein
MDPLEILKRAWNILWSYRALWVFALLLGLTAGGSSPNWPGNGDNIQYNLEDNQDFSEFMREMQRLFRGDLGELQFDIPANIWTTIILVGAGIILLALVLAIVFTVIHYVSETAVIRMVDARESTASQPGVRAGFRLGWSRAAWRLFLINLLVSLPVFLLVLFLVLAGIGIFLLTFQSSEPAWTAWAGFGVVALLVILASIVISIVLNLFRQFVWRASALEGAGVSQAFRRGFGIVRGNWQNVGLMWLILVGIGIAWAVVLFVAFFLLIPVYFLTGAIGLIVGGLPALLVGGIASLFANEWLPWVLAAIVGLPLFFLVTFSPLIFLGGLGKVFTSTVWTLTYRELAALEALSPTLEPEV